MKRGTVISLCDYSGVMVQPWVDAGYECIIVDRQHERGQHTEGLLTRVGADLLHWIPPQRKYVAAFAFPMCKNLAVSGARWFQEKGLRGLIDGLELVERCRSIIDTLEAAWMLENPVSTLSTYWRKPDFRFDPCEYAGYLSDPTCDAYTKRTCLWVGNGFVMPPTKGVLPALGSKMHLLPPSAERENLRSQTPRGFAQAVYEANRPDRYEPFNAAGTMCPPDPDLLSDYVDLDGAA